MELSILLAEDTQGIGKAGQRVNLELTPQDVHDPTEIPTYLAGYRPFGFRADEMSPIVLVDNDEDKYRTFSADDTFMPVDVKGATTGPIPEVDPKTTLATYKVVDRFVGSFISRITESQRGNAYAPNARMAAARRCRRAIDLDREIDVMTLLGTSANWAAAVRTAATNAWTDTTNGTPIADTQAAIEKSNQPVTGVWMNQKVAHTFLRHPEVKDQMRQMMGDQAATNVASQIAMLAAEGRAADFVIPGFPPFHVVASKYNNGSAITYVLGDVVVLVTRPPGVPQDGEEIASSYTFRRRGPSGVGFTSREFVVEGRGPEGGVMVVVACADIAVFTSNVAGGIITGVI
jgi:hypothetical protein